jgi:hypothetical protein
VQEKASRASVGAQRALLLDAEAIEKPGQPKVKPPASKPAIFVLSPILPYILSAIVLFVGVFIAYKAVSAFTHAIEDPLKQFLLHSLMGVRVKTSPDAGMALILDIAGVTALIFNACRIRNQVAQAEAFQRQTLYEYQRSIISAFEVLVWNTNVLALHQDVVSDLKQRGVVLPDDLHRTIATLHFDQPVVPLLLHQKARLVDWRNMRVISAERRVAPERALHRNRRGRFQAVGMSYCDHRRTVR